MVQAYVVAVHLVSAIETVRRVAARVMYEPGRAQHARLSELFSYHESRRRGKLASAAHAKRCTAVREHFPTRYGGVGTVDFLRPGAPLKENCDLCSTGERRSLEGGRGTGLEE